MRKILFRCSSLGKLMTEPRSKSETLSMTAKSHIRELAAQEIFGVEFEISDKKIEKGNAVEPKSIALFSRVRGVPAIKNTKRFNDDFLTGEPDLIIPGVRGVDLKSAWSLATFPISPEDVETSQRNMYEWQMRGYMKLTGLPEWEIAYAIVDTPEKLIGYESMAVHIVSHIEERLRLTSWMVYRDLAIEKAIEERVLLARAYYSDVIRKFDESHLADVAESIREERATKTPALAIESIDF